MKNPTAMRAAEIVNSRPVRFCISIGIAFFISLSSTLVGSFPGVNGQIVIYLEASGSIDREIILQMDSAVLEGGIADIAIEISDTGLNSSDLSEKQMLLVEQDIPEGRYESLHLRFKDIRVITEGNEVHFRPRSEGIKIPIKAHIAANTTEPLYLLWILESSGLDTDFYQPRLRIIEPEIPPPGAVIFVTNEGSGNVSVIDRFTHKVIDVIGVGEMPRGMAYSRLSQQLFVANSGSNSVSVIDITSRKVLRTIQLNFGDEPSRLGLSPDERFIYIVNHGSDRLAVYDIRTFHEAGDYALGAESWGIAVDRLRGSAYISNRMSDDISVLEPAAQAVSRAISSSGSPTELIVNSSEYILYLSYDGRRLLSAMEMQSGISTPLISLCSSATGLAYNRNSRLLYASLGKCDEVAVIKPQARLNLGSIRLPGSPGLITLDYEDSRLLVILPDSNQLAIVNVISKRVVGIINVGQKPYMAVALE